MSRNESEWGQIHFSKTGYSQFVRQLRTEYNAYIKTVREAALKAHEKLSALKPKERKAAFDEMTGRSTLYLNPPRKRHTVWGIETVHDGGVEMTSTMLYTIREELFRGKNGAFTKPRMIAFPTLTNKQVEFTIECDDGDFTLKQDKDGTGTLYWKVDENNHAVDHAKETGAYQAVSRTLANYKWKRNEGGVWYGDDEYTRDGARESGCSSESYRTATFGPIGEREKEMEHQALMARYGGARKRSRKRKGTGAHTTVFP